MAFTLADFSANSLMECSLFHGLLCITVLLEGVRCFNEGLRCLIGPIQIGLRRDEQSLMGGAVELEQNLSTDSYGFRVDLLPHPTLQLLALSTLLLTVSSARAT